MRTLSSTLLTEIGAIYTRPLWLVELQAVSTTYRISTWDQAFTFGGHTWQPAGLTVDGLALDGKLRRNGRLIFTDADITWWALGLNDELTARPVYAWAAYAGASNEAVAQFAGRTGGPYRQDGQTLLDLVNESANTKTTPRARIGLATGATQMVPAGTIFYVGGAKYILDRPKA